MTKSKRILPAALTTGVLAISTAAAFVKLCGDAAPAVIAAARLGLATIILAPVVLYFRGPRILVMRPAQAGRVALAGALLAAHFYFWISSLQYTSVLSSVVIVTTNPIFVGLASFLIFREPLRRGLVVGIVVAAAGGAIIMLADRQATPGSIHGDLLSLGAAVAMSCYLLTGRSVRRQLDVWAYILPVYAIAAILLCLVAWLQGDRFAGHSRATYGYFLLLALVPQLLGHSCLNFALGHASATLVAICILGEPIGASLIAYFALGEPVHQLQAAGSALILVGIFIAARAEPIEAASPDMTAM